MKQPIPGGRPSLPAPPQSGVAACVRCGIVRAARNDRPNSTGLCRDCMAVLTKEEVQQWLTSTAA